MKNFWDNFFYWVNRAAPARFITWLCGWIAECRWSPLKNFLIKNFIKMYHINMAEVLEPDPTAYVNFNAFFTRELHPSAVAIDTAPDAFISPAQGILSATYQLNDRFYCESKNLWLQGDKLVDPRYLNGRDKVRVVYLSPSDYHRVHAPCDGVVVEIKHSSGRLLSVAPNLLTVDPALLQKNDYVALTLLTEYGYVSVVLVGAMIVGSIEIKQDTAPYAVRRGDELGLFKLGSTVIIMAPESIEMIDYQGRIQVGACIGKVKN